MVRDPDSPRSSLRRRALTGLVQFVASLALFTLLPAWTVRFWQAWAYLTVFTCCTWAITVYFLDRDPELIERRLHAGPTAEREPAQRRVQSVASGFLIALFVVCGLDRHWRWSSTIDGRVSLLGDAATAVGFLIIFLTFRANSYAAATIEIGAAQSVISTGPYGFVRHPMYSGAILLFLATPLALGSWWALLPATGLALAIVVRLLNEERYLSAHLAGYVDYMGVVRSRLIPALW